MIINEPEDYRKLSAPLEPTPERWEEPDEHIDYLETYEPTDNEQ